MKTDLDGRLISFSKRNRRKKILKILMSYVINLKLNKRKHFTVFMLCWEVGIRQKLHFMSIIGKKSV